MIDLIKIENSKRTEKIGIRVNLETKNKLIVIADVNKCSLSKVVTYILEETIKEL